MSANCFVRSMHCSYVTNMQYQVLSDKIKPVIESPVQYDQL